MPQWSPCDQITWDVNTRRQGIPVLEEYASVHSHHVVATKLSGSATRMFIPEPASNLFYRSSVTMGWIQFSLDDCVVHGMHTPGARQSPAKADLPCSWHTPGNRDKAKRKTEATAAWQSVSFLMARRQVLKERILGVLFTWFLHVERETDLQIKGHFYSSSILDNCIGSVLAILRSTKSLSFSSLCSRLQTDSLLSPSSEQKK